MGSKRNKIIAAVIVGLLLLAWGLSVASRRLFAAGVAAGARSSVHEARAVAAEKEVATLLAQKSIDSQVNDGLRRDLDRALAQRQPLPPKPPPIPTEAPEVMATLKLAGISASVRQVGENLLVLEDARKALQWHQDALQLPGAMVALGHEKDALESSLKLVAGLNTELATCGQALTAQSDAYRGRVRQVGELQTANSTLEKRIKVVVWKKNLTLVVAVPVAAYIGWRVARK
jgi:hypothetical protein